MHYYAYVTVHKNTVHLFVDASVFKIIKTNLSIDDEFNGVRWDVADTRCALEDGVLKLHIHTTYPYLQHHG